MDKIAITQINAHMRHCATMGSKKNQVSFLQLMDGCQRMKLLIRRAGDGNAFLLIDILTEAGTIKAIFWIFSAPLIGLAQF